MRLLKLKRRDELEGRINKQLEILSNEKGDQKSLNVSIAKVAVSSLLESMNILMQKALKLGQEQLAENAEKVFRQISNVTQYPDRGVTNHYT